MHHTKKYHNYHSRRFALGSEGINLLAVLNSKSGDNMRNLILMTRDIIGATSGGFTQATELVGV
jgi:hypothetical protein